MSDTHVSITGFVATDVKFVRSDRGTALASFRLGSTPRRYDRLQGAWVDGRTTFVTVICWRTLADNVASSLNKGEPVVVIGRLRVEDWERDGRSGTSAEIEAQSIGHDQARGTSMFRKTQREAAAQQSDNDTAIELARSWDQPESAPSPRGSETATPAQRAGETVAHPAAESGAAAQAPPPNPTQAPTRAPTRTGVAAAPTEHGDAARKAA